MVTCYITPRIALDFWFEKDTEVAILYCKQHSDQRSISECEKYPILSITKFGEVKRHEGMPIGWGFHLTNKRKIKEMR